MKPFVAFVVLALCSVSLYGIVSAEDCKDVTFRTLDDTCDGSGIFGTNTIEVEGFGLLPREACGTPQAEPCCALGIPGGFCTIELCDAKALEKVTVSFDINNPDNSNGWIFQVFVNEKPLKTEKLCEELTEGAQDPESICACGKQNTIGFLDTDFDNSGPETLGNVQVVFLIEPESNILLIGGIIAGTLVLVAGIAFYIKRKKSVAKLQLPLTTKNPASDVFESQVEWSDVNGKHLSVLLATRFSIKPGSQFGSELPPESEIDVKEHKLSISKTDKSNFSYMRAQSARYSSFVGNTSSFQNANMVRTSVQLYSNARLVIEALCEKLEEKTLTMESAKKDEFSGVKLPAISIEDYIYRLVKGLDSWFYDVPGVKAVGMRSLLIRLVYIERIREKVPDFELSVWNQHRIFAVTMLLGAKFTEDCLIANSFWAEVAGVEVKELNKMERTFCKYAAFDFYVTNEQFMQLKKDYNLNSLLKQTMSP